MTSGHVFKICSDEAWAEAIATGSFTGSADDERDGFIHLSTAEQLAETAAKHFRHEPDLVLVTVDVERLGAALIWEPSRGGALFPHLYAEMPVEAAVAVAPLPLDDDGIPVVPDIAALNDRSRA